MNLTDAVSLALAGAAALLVGCAAPDSQTDVSGNEADYTAIGDTGIAKSTFLGSYTWQAKSAFVDFTDLELKSDGAYVAKVDAAYVDPSVRCVRFPCTLEESGVWNIYRSRVTDGMRLRVTPKEGRARYYELALTEHGDLEVQLVGWAEMTVLARNVPAKSCVVSGCNAELCGDGVQASMCIWKEVFACYKTATCERGTDGECGWRSTPELTSCLGN